MKLHCSHSGWSVVLLVLPNLARAEPPPSDNQDGTYRTEVTTQYEGLRPEQRRLNRETPGFVSTVKADEHRTELSGLPNMLSQVPGATVRSIGGLGQFSSVALRGASALQTPIYIDGVPLDGALSGLADLSRQPVAGLGHIEVYRGYIPAELGGSGFGGAINLVGQKENSDPVIRSSLGLGSFLARQARLDAAFPLPPGPARAAIKQGMSVVGAYAGARGDFPYFDDGGTPTFLDDDGQSRRENNHYDRVHLQLAHHRRRGKLAWRQRYLFDFDERGVPGLGSQSASETRARQLGGRSIYRLTWRNLGPRTEQFDVRLSPAWSFRHYLDPEGQVGVGRNDQRSHELDGYIRVHHRMRAWPGLFVDSALDLRGQWIRVNERDVDPDAQVLASGDATRSRGQLGADVQLEQHIVDARWRISARLRMDMIKAAFEVPDGDGESFDEGRDQQRIAWSPRVAATLWLAPGLDLRASFGRHRREPTLMELFGDRGYIVGNEGLQPETSTSVDGGLSYARAWPGKLELDASVAGFSSWTRDIIQWQRSGAVVRPENIVGARIRGIEAGLSARILGEDLQLDGNYTLLDTFNESPRSQEHGRQLAGRPRHNLRLASELSHEFRLRSLPLRPRVGYEYTFISGNFLDPSGRYELPARNLHALRVGLVALRRIYVDFSIRNLTDLRRGEVTPSAGPPKPYPVAIADYIGYPLPGRSVWGTIRVDFFP